MQRHGPHPRDGLRRGLRYRPKHPRPPLLHLGRPRPLRGRPEGRHQGLQPLLSPLSAVFSARRLPRARPGSGRERRRAVSSVHGQGPRRHRALDDGYWSSSLLILIVSSSARSC